MEGIIEQTISHLRELVDKHFDGNVNAASRYLEVPGANLNQWLRGIRKPSLRTIGPILEKMGIVLQPPGIDSFEFALVPKVSAVAGAGESFETSAEVKGYYAFQREFLRARLINPDKCVLLDVRGDSMEPLIREGDTILVDSNDKSPQDGKIFIVGLEDALMIKRMEKIPGGWRLASENQTRGNTDVQGDELDKLVVHGRVRWFGRVI